MDKRVVIPYKPHWGQVLLHNDTHRYKVIVCGRRWGKTIYAANKIIKSAVENPGLYWYIAPTYKQAKLIAWEIFKKYAVQELLLCKPNEAELKITLVNGAVIMLMGADNPDSLRGVGLKGVVLDEFADIKREVWTKIVRPMLADYKGWADFTGTPKGKNNHLYEHFIKDIQFFDKDYRTPENVEIEVDANFKSFTFRTLDNPYIDPLEVETARNELAPQYFRQEWEASFEDYTGIIYKEFIPSKHVFSISREFVKDWWHMYVGIDTGRHTAIGFVVIDDKGKMYIIDEIYDYDGIVKDLALRIKLKLAEWGRTTATFIIDSASQVKREYEANGISCVDSEKDVLNSIAKIRARFKNDTIAFNADKAPMHIVEHKGYVWNEKSKKTEPLKENDHTCNEIQYIESTYMTIKSIDHEKVKAQKHTIQHLNTRKPQNRAILRNS